MDKYRTLNKWWKHMFISMTLAGILLSVYQIFYLYEFTGILFMGNSYLYILMGIFLSLVFIIIPATERAARDKVPWYDVFLALLMLGLVGYFAWNGMKIISDAWEFTAPMLPTVLSILLWILVLEAGRRAAGMGLFVFVTIASLYPLFAGKMPGMFSGFSLGLLETARYHGMSTQSIIGIPMNVLGTIFIGFIVMGATLFLTGAGAFFLEVALSICGRFRGGPAKVAVLASGFFGMISGSAVSNVMATGSMTIPSMTKSGYPGYHAGALVTCSAVGGVLMPPVMGAVAFIMAQMLNMPYWQVALSAAVPGTLYYFGLFMHADAYALRQDIKGLSKAELPPFLGTLKKGWYHFGAIIVLVWLLAYLRQEAQAPFYATIMLFIVAGFKKENRLTWSKFMNYLQTTGRTLAELTGILSAVGVLLGSLSVTGMGVTFSSDLVHIAGENVYILLLMGAITSLILGLGLTVTACYLFLAITMAPALVNQGFNLMAVHMFILYWGVLSDITPPVCMAAFAAASIAGAPQMRTGWEAMRLGGILYFIPFFFVLNPVLVLQGFTLLSFLEAFISALVGISLIAGGLQGYLVFIGRLGKGAAGWLMRIPVIVSGILIGWPDRMLTLAGLVICIPILIGNLVINRRGRQPKETAVG